MRRLRWWWFVIVALVLCLAQFWRWSAPDTWGGQPTPRIIAKEPPVVHRGIGMDGRRLAPEGARLALPPTDWKPQPESTFRSGDTMWVTRYDCFIAKMDIPILQRQLIGDDGSRYDLPDVMPPKTTPTDQCSRANIATVLREKNGREIAPQWYTYVVNAVFYKNPLQRSVIVPFAPVRVKIVE